MSEELDRFGEFVMKNFRDQAIDYFDRLSRSEWKAPSLKPLQMDLKQFNEKQLAIIRRCIISTVDSALHDFLFAVQESSDLEAGIKISVNDTNIAEISDGLHGELFGEDGWYVKYSKFGEAPLND